MARLIQEGEELVSAHGDPSAKDAALIAAAQRIEHYEIAAYGTARSSRASLATTASRMLDETLDEESQADELLTKIAAGGLFKSGVNEAAHSTAA